MPQHDRADPELDGTQVFCDDAMLASTDNVWQSLHHPVKHEANPVLVPRRATGDTLRKLFGLALRQSVGFVQSLLDPIDVPVSTPDHTTLSRRQKGLRVILPIKPRDQPRDLVVDSTGLKLYGEGEWKTRQHGWTQRRTWRKLHLGVDPDTGEVTAETLTEAGTDDASQVKPILALPRHEGASSMPTSTDRASIPAPARSSSWRVTSSGRRSGSVHHGQDFPLHRIR